MKAPFRSRILAAPALALCATMASAQPTPILVVVDSLEADPADTEVTLVVRTTVPGAVANGSFVLEAVDKDGGNAQAFASVVSATAYSTAADATASAVLDVPNQRIDVSFASASGTMNEAFGPLVSIRLGLQSGLPEDERFDLRVVPGLTELWSPTAELLDVLADRGRLRMRPADPGSADIAPLGGEIPAGEVAVFGAKTGRPFAIGSGTVEILFDSLLAGGVPDLVIDPRYGTAVIDSLDVSTPGRVLATFHSPDGDLNEQLYGMVFAVTLVTDSALPVGAIANLILGPATELFDPLGDPLDVEGGDADVIEIVPADVVLRAAFEQGDFLEFTATN
ncbi:MAG: hypothetical protein R2862_11105 [Thermoanaerobaculia bacterium]